MSEIIVDASAVVAMLESEPEAPSIRLAFVGASRRWIGAVGALECSIVLQRRRGALAAAGLDLLLSRYEVGVIPFDQAQLALAMVAYDRYGKGRHPASLNLGDCCAYAAARSVRLPLLQKGNDFKQTDLELVKWA